MRPARIAELLEPFLPISKELPHSESSQGSATGSLALSPPQLQAISTYIDILIRWNARINLTAIRDQEEIVTRHFGESLFVAQHLFPAPTPTSHARLADLGSGAGFPGLPIKLWAPDIAITLVESNQKKATFLREITRTLTLENTDVRSVRAESLPASSFEVVTIRAIERLTTVLPIASALLTPHGRLALLVSSPQLKSIYPTLPGLRWDSPVPVPQSRDGVLLVGQHSGR